MLDLTLHGAARPLPVTVLARLQRPWGGPPADYVRLVSTWGPGTLCGMFELPDPSERGGRFDFLQDTLRVRGPACRLRGMWAQLADAELAEPLVLGVDRRGVALAGCANGKVALLYPSGHVTLFVTLEMLVASYLLGDGFDRSRAHKRWNEDVDHGVPRVYVTDPSARAAFLDALAAGDEAAADAALETVLAREVATIALLELIAHLAGPAGAAIPHEQRASYADQLWRMAKRCAPQLDTEIDHRAIQRALRVNATAPREVVAALTANAIVEPPAGIFLVPDDATEVALVSAVAADPEAREVYADYLEERGELARAEAMRAELVVPPPLPDAAARGFIAPPGFPPVDGAARLREYVERWRTDAPATPIDDLLARIEALHPAEQQGHALLLAMHVAHHRNAMPYLLDERPRAWPLLVLALRSPHRREPTLALELLVDGNLREAAPYILSTLRHPTPYRFDWSDWGPSLVERLAVAYVALGTVDRALAEEFAPHFADERSTAARTVAFHLCESFADDDRIFEGYLVNFVAAYPMSERALAPRRKDPRVVAALRAELEREEKRAIFAQEGRHPMYSDEYGILAKYLAKLGDAKGKAAAEAYRKFTRWMARQPL